MAKFVCNVCGYVYEGDAAPEFCPICKAPASKFTKQEEGMTWASEHVVGVAKDVPEDIIADLRANFEGECSEVYRNLALLSELGEIKKLTTGDGADHFDGNVSPHQHVICKKCHRILDLELNNQDYMRQASSQFSGEIESCTSYFYGTCADCLKN